MGVETKDGARAELDRCVIAHRWVDTYAGVIAAEVVEYARSKGADIARVDGLAIRLGVVVEDFMADHLTPGQVLDAMAEVSGYTWRVDDAGVVHFGPALERHPSRGAYSQVT